MSMPLPFLAFKGTPMRTHSTDQYIRAEGEEGRNTYSAESLGLKAAKVYRLN